MKEVHIIGKGPGWDLAPDEGETWGANDLLAWRNGNVKLTFYIDRHLHLKEDSGDLSLMNDVVTERCNKHHVPVFCTQKYDDIPTSMEFPIYDIIDAFGGIDYFGNSIDYMIAYAIYMGFEHIHLYGVNMKYGTVYIWEKPVTSFWLGVAIGHGVEVSVHGANSEMLFTADRNLYSYGTVQNMDRENIKINKALLKGAGQTGATDMNLTSKDRIIIPAILPTNGTAEEMEARDDLINLIDLSDDEKEQLKVRNHQDKPSVIVFDETVSTTKDFDIPADCMSLLVKTMEGLSLEKKITPHTLPLYKKVMEKCQ